MPDDDSSKEIPKMEQPRGLKELNNLTKNDLMALCTQNGLATDGKRNALYRRLREFYKFDSGGENSECDVNGIEKNNAQTEMVAEKECPMDEEPIGKSEDVDAKELMIELMNLNRERDHKSDLRSIIDVYDTLLEVEDGNEYILIHKGICLQYLQEYDKAVECYIDALKRNPDNVEARVLLEGARLLGLSRTFKSKSELPLDSVTTNAGFEIGHPTVAQGQEIQKAIPEAPAGQVSLTPVTDSKAVAISHETEVTKPAVEPAMATASETPVTAGAMKAVKDKIHIAGTKSVSAGEKQKSLFGNDFSAVDTATLTESKTKLSSVLQELKSELHRGQMGIEKPPLKEAPDSEKSDSEFGSKILSSARKLLGMTTSVSTPEMELSAATEVKTELEHKVRVPRALAQIRTGNVSLDKLLHGGYHCGSNILIDGPSFVEKDIFLYRFAALGLRMNIPCIIINPETAPDTIKQKLKLILGDITEYENNGLISWLDPESEEIKGQFKHKPGGEFPEPHKIILDGLDHFSKKSLADHDQYNLIFFSITPLVMFQEPQVINKFLSRLSKKVKDDNSVALYTIDNTVVEPQHLNFVKRVMDGVIEVKQEAGTEHGKTKNFIRIDKLPYASSYEWQEYIVTEKSFELKALPVYKKVL